MAHVYHFADPLRCNRNALICRGQSRVWSGSVNGGSGDTIVYDKS